MNIAVIGSGISGLLCAYLLCEHHSVTLFERDHRIGGHTSTVTVSHEGQSFDVDTGFIVFNERNYPGFCRLLARLGVQSRPSTMSFSVRDDATGFEYGGSSLRGVVGAWSNLLRPRWWRIIHGIVTLGRRGKDMLAGSPDSITLGELCRSRSLSPDFVDGYLLPMAGAIWSAPRRAVLEMPAAFFLRFFDNHGMLDLRERPRWRTVEGGSHTYVRAMMRVIHERAAVKRGCRVRSIARRGNRHAVGWEQPQASAAGEAEFDQVIIAAHADEALAMLADPTHAERGVLGAMPFQSNDTVLHTDQRLLPRRRACWAAWNYRVRAGDRRPVSVTYNMSILQGLATTRPLCVTLNDRASIDPAAILASFDYQHPLYTMEGQAARSRWAEISGVEGRHYCGAYWGNGFHEDGVQSALRVCARFGAAL